MSCGTGDSMDSIGGVDDTPASTVRSPCPEYRPALSTTPAAMGYPFGQHCSEDGGRSIHWSVQVSGAVVSLHSMQEGRREACTGKSSSEGGPCGPCANLQYCPKVKGECLSNFCRP